MNRAAVQMGPACGFTIVGLVILLGPLTAERLRLPGRLGLLTTVIPMALRTGVALFLRIETRPAILIGSFWASVRRPTMRAAPPWCST